MVNTVDLIVSKRDEQEVLTKARVLFGSWLSELANVVSVAHESIASAARSIQAVSAFG